MSLPERSRSASPGRLFVRLITVLNVLAVLLYAYGLLGYQYWSGEQLVTGPHRPLTWAVLWLLLVTLAWAGQVWRYRRAFRRGLEVSAALLLTLLACAALLPVAGSVHTRFLQQHRLNTVSIHASVTRLEAVVYLPCSRPRTARCPSGSAPTFVNPLVPAAPSGVTYSPSLRFR